MEWCTASGGRRSSTQVMGATVSGVAATCGRGLRVRDCVTCGAAGGRWEEVGWGGEKLGLRYIHYLAWAVWW